MSGRQRAGHRGGRQAVVQDLEGGREGSADTPRRREGRPTRRGTVALERNTPVSAGRTAQPGHVPGGDCRAGASCLLPEPWSPSHGSDADRHDVRRCGCGEAGIDRPHGHRGPSRVRSGEHTHARHQGTRLSLGTGEHGSRCRNADKGRKGARPCVRPKSAGDRHPLPGMLMRSSCGWCERGWLPGRTSWRRRRPPGPAAGVRRPGLRR